MGYMTIISILNDGWETIKNHKDEFIEKIENAMVSKNGTKITHCSIHNFSSPLIVHSSQHADVPQVVLAQYNTMIDINESLKDNITLEQLKGRKKEIETVKSLIKCAEENVENVIGRRIKKAIKKDGKIIKELKIEEILDYLKRDEWAKEMKLCNKRFAKQIKQYYYLM